MHSELNDNLTEIKVHQALRNSCCCACKHCKPHCRWSCNCTVAQLECGDAAARLDHTTKLGASRASPRQLRCHCVIF